MRKEDIQEDRFQQFVTSVIKAYYRSPRNFQIGGVAVVAVIVAIIVLVSNKPRYNPEPNVLLDEAILTMQQQQPDTAGVEQLLTELDRRYGSDPAGRKGSYYLGILYFHQAKYDDALREFEKFYAGTKNDPNLSPASLMAIGNCYEEQVNLDRAAAAYASTYRHYPKWKLAGQAVLAAGRCYRQKGMYGPAEALYNSYIKANPKADQDVLNQVRLELALVTTLQSKR